MIKTQNKAAYQSTYNVSERRPWHHRMTPLAWFCVSLAALGLFAITSTLVNLWLESNNGFWVKAERAAVQSVTPATDADSAAAQAPSQRLIVPAVSQPKPKADAAFVPQQQTIVIATPASPAAAINDNPAVPPVQAASGSSKRSAAGAGGSGNSIAQDIKEYYKVTQKMPVELYLAERDTMLPTYFYGPGLTAITLAETKRETYDYVRAGEVDVKVLSVKGRNAVVKIKLKNWVSDIYDVKTKTLKEYDVKQELIEQTMRVAYDPAGGRWKFVQGFEELVKPIETTAKQPEVQPAGTKPSVKPAAKTKP